jgi:hypothetical protein
MPDQPGNGRYPRYKKNDNDSRVNHGQSVITLQLEDISFHDHGKVQDHKRGKDINQSVEHFPTRTEAGDGVPVGGDRQQDQDDQRDCPNDDEGPVDHLSENEAEIKPVVQGNEDSDVKERVQGTIQPQCFPSLGEFLPAGKCPGRSAGK